MALYKQLSIPSQRFKPSLVPINSNSTASVIPPSSSQVPPSRQVAEKSGGRNLDSSGPLMQLEQNKKLEEDDFRVPIFMQSNMGQDCGKNRNTMDRESVCSSGRASTLHSLKHLNTIDHVPKQLKLSGPTVRQKAKSHLNEESLKDFVPSWEQSIKAVSNSSSMKNNEVALKQNNRSLCHESFFFFSLSCSPCLEGYVL